MKIFTVLLSKGGLISLFACLSTCLFAQPSNDNCSAAILLTSSTSCMPTTGTTVAATQSIAACNAQGTADDDVWYQFVATHTEHTVTVSSTLLDVVINLRIPPCNGGGMGCFNSTGTGGTETAALTGLTIGSTYLIRVYSAAAGTNGTFTICVTHEPDVPNDECSGAILLTSSVACIPTSGNTSGATQSLPACTASNNADDDVWYKFVATNTQHTVQVTTPSSTFPGTLVALDVRSGSCNGTSIACQSVPVTSVPDFINTQTANLSNLTIGATYYARVYSQGNDFINFSICVTQPPPPANDDCANAVTLIPSSTTCNSTAGTTSNASQSLAACGSGTADDDVWYKFVATATTHKISVFSGGLDFIFDVRTGACNGTSIACVNNAGDGGTESTTLTNFTIGNTYYVRVYTLGTTGGSFDICVGPPTPANDDCINAILLTSSETCVNTSGTTIGATQSLTDCSGGNNSNDDVWYKFVAVSPYHTVTVYSATLNLVLNVRSGACDGTTLGCAVSGGTGDPETLTFTNLTVGATYYVRVFTQGFSTFGSFVICVTHIPGPANDNCAGAILLTPSATCTPTSGTTQYASGSLPDCNGGSNSDDDVWYKFVAVSTTHIVTVSSPTLNMVLDPRSGACDGTSLGCVSTGGIGATETSTLTGLTPGVTYYVRVFTQGTSTGAFTICVSTPPVNDDCAGAIVLTSSNACNPVTGNTAGATESTSNCAITTANELWYQFVAVSTSHTITGSSTTLDMVLNVRNGGCAGNSSGCINSTGAGGTESATFNNLTVGTTYFIRVFSADPMLTGTFTICVTHPPANDDCSGAFSLTSGTSCSNTNGSTAGATQSIAQCATTTAKDVWYQFVAVSPNHTITVASSTMDMVVNVRSDACPGTGLGCTNSTGLGGTETVNFSALTVGATYYIRVFGDNPAVTGTFTICVTHVPIPANDDCAGAVVLTPGASCTPTTGTTITASQSLPDCSGGNDSDDDVWYRFVASATTHVVTVAPVGPSFDLAMDVRTGGACNGASLLCQNSSAAGVSEAYTFTSLTIGATYYVRVFGINGRGSFTICVTTPPANDECSGAVLLTSGTSCSNSNGTTVGATQSLPSCGSGTSDDDVWYRFVAVYSVQTITVSSATLNLEMNVRTGACPGTDLICVNATGTGGVEVATLTNLTVGATYYVRVYSVGTNTGTFTICVTHPAAPVNDDCANAVNLNSSPACSTTTGTTSGATQSIVACTGTANEDVWYKFTALSSSHTVTVSSSEINTVINVRSGICNGTDIGCFDNVSGLGTETANLTGLTVGQTYLIRVYSAGTTLGTFTICVTHQLPANDECTGAVNLTPVAGTFTDPGMQSNALATQTTSGAFCPGSFAASSNVEDVWYRFTTNSSGGTINISATPADGTGNPLIHFFAGCNVGPVACNDQGGPGAMETLIIPGLSANSTYYFRVYGQNSPAFPFTLALSGSAVNSVLPLELASFSGRVEEHANVLTWTTLSEKNVQFHILEYTVDGTEWTELGRLDGQLDSHEPVSYFFEDRKPPARAFYRLRSVDYDGAISLSASIVLTRQHESFGILHLFPSPAHDLLNVQFNTIEEESALLRILNTAGQQIWAERVEATSGLNELRLTLTDLPAGVYFLQLSTDRQVASPQRFVKE